MALPEPVSRAIGLIKRLPGLGEKSARRLVFQILQDGTPYQNDLIEAFETLRDKVTTCERCGNITVAQPCDICADPLRDHSKLCIVETLEDLAAIEAGGIYHGLYFNLALAADLLEDRETLDEDTCARLLELVENEPLQEVIIATNPRVEGDITFYLLQDLLAPHNLIVTRPAYGLPVGGTIEFADRVTLHAAFERRRPMDGSPW